MHRFDHHSYPFASLIDDLRGESMATIMLPFPRTTFANKREKVKLSISKLLIIIKYRCCLFQLLYLQYAHFPIHR